MGICAAIAWATVLLTGQVSAAVIQERQASNKTKRYCDSLQGTGVCYSEITAPSSGTIFRLAIPEVQRAPFDTLVQIVAPVSVGWVGLAFGGSMVKSPLAVVWVDGDKGFASPRWATGHTPPTPYPDASLSILGTAKNSTHWTVHALCRGCSSWSSSITNVTTTLNPNGANRIGFATSKSAPATPGSNTSSIGIHSEKGVVLHDLSVGKVDPNVFRQYLLYLSSPAASRSSAISASTSPVAPTTPLSYPTTIIRPSQTMSVETPSSVVTQPPQTTIDASYAPTTIHGSTRQSTGVTVTVTVTAAPRPFQPTPAPTPCNRFSGFGGFGGFGGGRLCTTLPYGGGPYGGDPFGRGGGGGNEYGGGDDDGDDDGGPFEGDPGSGLGGGGGFEGGGYGGGLRSGGGDFGDENREGSDDDS